MARGPRWPSTRRLSISLLVLSFEIHLLDAVRIKEPPGPFLPFSGQVFANAGAACLMAMKTLNMSSVTPDLEAHLKALTRMTSIYSSSDISPAIRVRRLRASIPSFSPALARTWEIPALAKKKSRWPSSFNTRATREEMASPEAASALMDVNCAMSWCREGRSQGKPWWKGSPSLTFRPGA
jgi:hypothetical protein